MTQWAQVQAVVEAVLRAKSFEIDYVRFEPRSRNLEKLYSAYNFRVEQYETTSHKSPCIDQSREFSTVARRLMRLLSGPYRVGLRQ
jgi:hypothetical protein